MSAPEVDPIARAELRVGSTLKDKWRLDRLLGVGGMAAVYAATHRNASRVAVKILHRELSLDEHVRSRFVREGYLANNVQHAGVVRVHDDDVDDDGSVFLVMDLLEGETLDSRWEKAGYHLPLPEAIDVVAKLLDVLGAAHTRGIVHRDIKPENIFVTHEGTVKLLDFGVARLADGGTATINGATIGTPSFMPPEQALGRIDQVDAQSDLWAAGAVLFSLLSGRFVQDGTTANELLVASATRRAPPLATVLVRAPAALCEVVDRSLSYEKEGRFANAAEMSRALETARTAPYVQASPSLPPHHSSIPSIASLPPATPGPHATFLGVTSATLPPASPVSLVDRAPSPRSHAPLFGGALAVALGAAAIWFLAIRAPDPASTQAPTASSPAVPASTPELPASTEAPAPVATSSGAPAPVGSVAVGAPSPAVSATPAAPTTAAATTGASRSKTPPKTGGDKPKTAGSWLDRQH